jgi:hypothetical protein
MIADIESWVAEYAMRRYPSDAPAANTHVAAAWAALLDAAYGGNHTVGSNKAEGLRSASASSPSGDHLVTDAMTLALLNSRASGGGGDGGDSDLRRRHSPLRVGATDSSPPSTAAGQRQLGSRDSDIFVKDGLARFPSLTLGLYTSPKPAGLVSAWTELLAAVAADPAVAHASAFRYDLVDVVRQSLQNLFAKTFASLKATCAGGGAGGAVSKRAIGGGPDGRPHAGAGLGAGGNYTEYPSR